MKSASCWRARLRRERKALSSGFMGGLQQSWFLTRVMKFAEFSDAYTQALDKVFTDFGATRGIILDLRCNDGGIDDFAYLVGSRFVKEKTLGHSRRTKTGPGSDDYTAVEQFHLEPPAPPACCTDRPAAAGVCCTGRPAACNRLGERRNITTLTP